VPRSIIHTLTLPIYLLTALFSTNAQSAIFFVEIGSALSPVSLSGVQSSQVQLMRESLGPVYNSNTSEFKYSDINDNIPTTFSLGVIKERLELKFMHFHFNKSKASLTTNYEFIAYAGNNQAGQFIDKNSQASVITSRSISARSYSMGYINPITSNLSWKPIIGILDWSITDEYNTLTTGQFGSTQNSESDKSANYNFFFGLDLSYSINDIFSLNFNINRYKFGTEVVPIEAISFRVTF
jgi:hypothetical protein